MLVRNRLVKNANVRLKGRSTCIVCSLALPFALLGGQRAHGQVCQVFCDGSLAGDCPGGVGCPQTPEECLAGMCLTDVLPCGCLSTTDCQFDGVSIMPTPVCGDGQRQGTEECDPGPNPFGEEDCNCPGQCQANCTCPGPGVCQVYCDGALMGDCPGGVGCPETPEECLTGLCLNEIACGCLSLTDCKWDGASILPTPVCGNGNRDGTEECDPAGGPADEADCNCPGQCQPDCTCPLPPGATGACCDRDPFGGCTDGLTRAECNCARCEWTELALCGDVTCLREAIPTVSEWGLLILALSLLTGAKLRFGRRTAAG